VSSPTSSNQHEVSKVSAIKDQAIGTVKQVIGNVIGNNKMEVEGKAQKILGKNEYQDAKMAKNEATPNPHAYDPQTYHQQAFPDPAQPEPLTPNVQEPTNAPGQTITPAYNQTVPPTGAQPAPVPSQPKPFSAAPSSQEPSQMSGLKDQAVGSIKENVGSATNNPQMEMAGKAQNIHGHNEAEFAKAKNEGYNEPQHFEHGTKTTEQAQGKVEGDNVSSLSAIKDQAVGSVKESFGSATDNQKTELEGKAQKIHGKNEAEFAKAQKQGFDQPEHFAHGTKTTEHAHGEVEDQSVSTLGAIKDKAMGSIKDMYGSMTGDQDMELKGKAQNLHGRNEAEFVKAQKQGLSEPQHFEHGTKTTEQAQSKVEGDKVSSLSAIKDQAVGSVKESFGSATGNQKTELEGKAQKIHGKNEAEFAKAQKQGFDQPEHFDHGTKTTEHSEGEVVGQQPSNITNA